MMTDTRKIIAKQIMKSRTNVLQKHQAMGLFSRLN